MSNPFQVSALFPAEAFHNWKQMSPFPPYAANDVVEAWKAVYDPAGEEPGDDPVVDPETGVTYNVTVPAGTKACYIAGEMNSWSFTEMTKIDDTHYTVTLAEATDTMGYKYCSGPGWAYVELTEEGGELG